MAPKRKAAAAAAKEDNGVVLEVKKRGRPPARSKGAAPEKAVEVEKADPASSPSPPPSPAPEKRPRRKVRETLVEIKEKPAPKAKPAAKENPTPKAKAATKEKAPKSKKAVPAKKAKKAKEEEENESEDQDEGMGEAPAPKATVTKSTNGAEKMVIIEHCKQCNSFKTRALKVQDALKKAIPGLQVSINPEKPRRGCFEIRDGEGNIFVSLQDMPRPFTKMKNLDLDVTAADIVTKLTLLNEN